MGVTTEVTTGGIMEATMEGIMAVITEVTMEASAVASAEDSDMVALEVSRYGKVYGRLFSNGNMIYAC